jgi:hypothetical protein
LFGHFRSDQTPDHIGRSRLRAARAPRTSFSMIVSIPRLASFAGGSLAIIIGQPIIPVQ